MDFKRLIALLEMILTELYVLAAEPEPDKPPPQGEPVSRVRFRVLRAQYNRAKHPEMYTPDNPMGLYSGKAIAAALAPGGHFNTESNVWLDLTAYDGQGVELSRDHIKRIGLAYQTEFRIGDGHIVGRGAKPDGTPVDWVKQNPDGANISEETWRTSLGFTVRVHLSDEKEWRCTGAVRGQEGDAIVLRAS